MIPSSRTPEGEPNRCPVCRKDIRIEPSRPPGDAPCPHCGHLLWFAAVADLDLFAGNGTVHELDVSTKSEVVETLVRKLSELDHLRPHLVDSIVAAIMHREELGSTALGRGFAIPHVEHDAIERFVGIIGHVPGGIDLWSPDGTPVTKVFLLLSPPGKPPEQVRALEQISRYVEMSS